MFEYNEKNQLYAWSASNAKIKLMDNGQIKPIKARPGKRIDLIASTLDAWKLMLCDNENYTPEESVDDFLNMLNDVRSTRKDELRENKRVGGIASYGSVWNS